MLNRRVEPSCGTIVWNHRLEPFSAALPPGALEEGVAEHAVRFRSAAKIPNAGVERIRVGQTGRERALTHALDHRGEGLERNASTSRGRLEST